MLDAAVRHPTDHCQYILQQQITRMLKCDSLQDRRYLFRYVCMAKVRSLALELGDGPDRVEPCQNKVRSFSHSRSFGIEKDSVLCGRLMAILS